MILVSAEMTLVVPMGCSRSRTSDEPGAVAEVQALTERVKLLAERNAALAKELEETEGQVSALNRTAELATSKLLRLESELEKHRSEEQLNDRLNLDCLPYDPSQLSVVQRNYANLGKLWIVAEGSNYMLSFDNEDDANQALALAKRHTAHCFIGRGNKRSNREDYIVEFWTGDSGIRTELVNDGVIRYDPTKLSIVDESSQGWVLTDGQSRLLMLDNKSDADIALGLAKRYTQLCFIGRGQDRVEYWTK